MATARLIDPPSASTAFLRTRIALLEATVARLLATKHVWQREYGVRRYHCRRCGATCSDPRLVLASCTEILDMADDGRRTRYQRGA